MKLKSLCAWVTVKGWASECPNVQNYEWLLNRSGTSCYIAERVPIWQHWVSQGCYSRKHGYTHTNCVQSSLTHAAHYESCVRRASNWTLSMHRFLLPHSCHPIHLWSIQQYVQWRRPITGGSRPPNSRHVQ